MTDLTSVIEWDKAAEGFQRTFELGPNEYNLKLLAFLEQNKMICPGCRAADIGCGVGIYSRQLALRGCHVTLMDISPEMLRYAVKNMQGVNAPFQTVLCDFSNDEPVGCFDFSLAAMSPAVCDAAAVRKMSAMTHGTCFITRFYTWEQPDRDNVLRMCGASPADSSAKHKAFCDELIGVIRTEGYSPQVKLEDYNWCDELCAVEAAEKIALRSDTPLDRNAVLTAVKKLSRNGLFTDRIFTKVAWIYWSTV